MLPGSSVESATLSDGAGGPGATPGPGATYLYAVVRKEMTGGALLSQFGHAITECLRPEDLPLPEDTRIVVLAATKEQFAKALIELSVAGVPHRAINEVDGVLAGVTTAVGLLTRDREKLKPILGELKPFRT